MSTASAPTHFTRAVTKPPSFAVRSTPLQIKAVDCTLCSVDLRKAVPVWHDSLGILPQGLDEAEDVVPATTVQASAVLPQLKQDLVHLKGSRQSLNQDCCLQGNAT